MSAGYPCLRRTALPVLALLASAACSTGQAAQRPLAVAMTPVPLSTPTFAVPASPTATPSAAPAAVALPPLAHRVRADVLVTGTRPLSRTQLRKVAALSPGAVVYASGTVAVGGVKVHAVSVDPASFRRFAAAGTAESTPVWQTLSSDQAVVSHALARRLHLLLGGPVHLAGGGTATDLRLGAFATTGLPGTDLLLDTATGRRLGLRAPTAVLLNAGTADPTTLAARVRALTGGSANVDLLTPPAANPVAFLTGSRAAKAFGAFSYRYFPDGTIQPDRRWVNANIQSGTVPIFGRVTCHRLMLPQLRGALTDVVRAGLASTLHTYDGCYVPRFIERNPEHAISLHTWGIAIDLDAATNYRGIRGTMDPRVVTIFKRWGFRWGGDFRYTDPMHFEIAALLTTPRG